jgi:hypothetical protein
VVARFGDDASDLTPVLTAFIRGSASIAFHEVAPADDGLLGRVRTKLAAIMPRLSTDAVDALAWRWPTVVPQTSPF